MRPRDGWRATVHLSLLLCFATPVPGAQADGAGSTVAALLRQTRADLKADRVEQARASAEKAAAQQPESSEAQYLLGLIHERQEDLPSAATAYGNAIRLAPLLAEAHDRLGFVLGKQGAPATRSPSSPQPSVSIPRCSMRNTTSARRAGGRSDLAGALPALTGGRRAPARHMPRPATTSASRSKVSAELGAGDRTSCARRSG